MTTNRKLKRLTIRNDCFCTEVEAPQWMGVCVGVREELIHLTIPFACAKRLQIHTPFEND